MLDPFAGTGTTSLVAHQLGRKSISIEKASRNVSCIRERVEVMRGIDDLRNHYSMYAFTDGLDGIWGCKRAGTGKPDGTLHRFT